MREIKLTVHPFRMGTDKEAAVKVLENAAESFSTWQEVDDCMTNGVMCVNCLKDPGRGGCGHKRDLADWLADCIQACCNLADRYGIDLAAAMERCEKRNRDRGRY